MPKITLQIFTIKANKFKMQVISIRTDLIEFYKEEDTKLQLIFGVSKI